MATNVDRKLLTIVFLSGTDHSVKVSSNFESVCAGALLEFFWWLRRIDVKLLPTYCTICYKFSMSIMLTIFDVSIKKRGFVVVYVLSYFLSK